MLSLHVPKIPSNGLIGCFSGKVSNLFVTSFGFDKMNSETKGVVFMNKVQAVLNNKYEYDSFFII